MGRIFLIVSAAVMMTACASISEEQCLAGNWEELGYKDGSNGVSVDRVSKYANVCSEHGVSVDQHLYSQGYEQGIQNYCTDTRGFRVGEGGSSFNQACTGFTDYELAFADGRIIYEIEQEYAYLLDEYENLGEQFYQLDTELKVEGITDSERKDLRRKQDRIKHKLRGLRLDIRDFETAHGFARTRLDGF